MQRIIRVIRNAAAVFPGVVQFQVMRSGILSDQLDNFVARALNLVLIAQVVSYKATIETLHFFIREEIKSCQNHKQEKSKIFTLYKLTTVFSNRVHVHVCLFCPVITVMVL